MPEDATARSVRPMPGRGDVGSVGSAAERTAAPLRHAEWTATVRGSDLVIVLTGDWTVRQTGVEADVAAQVIPGKAPRTLVFDAKALGQWDSALIVFLWDLQAAAARFQIEFDESGLPEPARRLLALASVEATHETRHSPHESLLYRTGLGIISSWREVAGVLDLVGDTLLRVGPAFRGRGGLRRIDVVD
jgi:phospholipid/cholesterol/gamma-HCH transport system permease protein